MYKILVADDEMIERKVICKTLKKNVGEICEIYEAKNGKEALEIFEREKIQIALLDIEMPGMTGLEAAKQMRSQDKSCVILFSTAYDDFSYAKQAILVEAMDYLLKPYEEKELVYAIEEAIQRAEKNQKLVELVRKQREKLGIKEKQNTITLEKGEETAKKKDHEEENIRLSVLKEKIETYIKENYGKELSVSMLAEWLNYSEAYFSKLFKQCFHVNFTTYLVDFRVNLAKEMIEDSNRSIKEIGRICGYEDPNYFSRIFKKATGFTPTEYRREIIQQKRG